MDSDANRIVGLYERHAAQYNQDRGRGLVEKPWLDRFCNLLPERGSVLDLGCGMGEPVASYLIAKGFGITGVDSSPAMIAMCANRFPGQGWIVHDMRTLSLDRSFDGILAWDSFFHVTPEDQRSMFAVFAKHASRQAVLMFTSGPRFGEVLGEYRGEPLYHASLDPEEYQALLSEIGFEVVAHVAEDQSCGGHTIWLAQRSPT